MYVRIYVRLYVRMYVRLYLRMYLSMYLRMYLRMYLLIYCSYVLAPRVRYTYSIYRKYSKYTRTRGASYTMLFYEA